MSCCSRSRPGVYESGRRCRVLLCLAALGAGCSACSDPGPGADASLDARAADLLPVDLAPADAPGPVLDGAVDAGDSGVPACGGSRKLTPKPIPRGAGMACGTACEQVTFGNSVSLAYEVAGNLLVYAGGPVAKISVYMVDLNADKEWQVQSTPPAYPGCGVVGTDGKRLTYSCPVWSGPSSVEVPLQVYDPSTQVEEDLYCYSPKFLKVDGKLRAMGRMPHPLGIGTDGLVATMALSTHANGQSDVFLYAFSSKTLVNLTKTYGLVWGSHVSGKLVAYNELVKQPSGGRQVQVAIHDTTTKTHKRVDPNGKPQFSARIGGTRVVWVDHRNAPGNMHNQGNSDIYMYDAVTGKTTAVTTHPAQQDWPDVSGDWVVWEDRRNNPDPTPAGSYSESDIFARNMNTGTTVQVSKLKGLELRPRVDNGSAFFAAGSTATKATALFMVDLSKLAP